MPSPPEAFLPMMLGPGTNRGKTCFVTRLSVIRQAGRPGALAEGRHLGQVGAGHQDAAVVAGGRFDRAARRPTGQAEAATGASRPPVTHSLAGTGEFHASPLDRKSVV